MSLSVVFRPVAQSELQEAVGWYQRFRPASQRTRRALVPGFPYAIHFAEEPDAIVILAVFHTRRDPAQT